MILLYGAIATVLTEVIKLLTKKLGKELAGAYILIALFLMCLIWAIVEYYAKIFTPGFWEILVGSFATGIAWYEVVLKNIWKIVKK